MAGSKTVLFIEDDPLVVDMYSHILSGAGYQVDAAYDGPSGLQKAQKKNYDLVLLDIMLPGMNGIQVLENLRGANGKGMPKTKIIILTNLAQSEESRQALEGQADAYFIKADVTPHKLIELIKQV